MVWYLDTSAFLKLVVSEPESSAMRTWMVGGTPCWSSQLLRTEALRAGQRLGITEETVSEALEAVSLIAPGPSTFLTAGRLPPAALRSLDAVHLATAAELGADLQGLVTYDARMLEGARIASMPTVTPT